MEAKYYKKHVADLIRYSLPNTKYGKKEIKVTILSNPPHKRGDNHNGLKIVFDAIELSGIIENDKQIVSLEIIPAEIQNPPTWTLKIEPYTIMNRIVDKIRYWNVKGNPEECC